MYDRMFDTWDFALNNPTWEHIFSNPQSFARHYGSKLLGLSPVKVIQDASEPLMYSKLGEDIWSQYGIGGLFKPGYMKDINWSIKSKNMRPKDVKAAARQIKKQMAKNPWPTTINVPRGQKVSKLSYKRKQWNHPNPFDK